MKKWRALRPVDMSAAGGLHVVLLSAGVALTAISSGAGIVLAGVWIGHHAPSWVVALACLSLGPALLLVGYLIAPKRDAATGGAG